MECAGTYNTAQIFAETVDPAALDQIELLCNLPFSQGSRIRIMPDVHAGVGCTIGTTMTVTGKVVPNMVGVDIGCGMETLQIAGKRFELQQLDRLIHAQIPAGMRVRTAPHALAEEIDLSQLHCAGEIRLDRAYRSIGTLGGGNHFIEADIDEDGNRYLVLHSGSRHLGVEVANFYQHQAFLALSENERRELEEAVTAAGKKAGLASALAYVSGDLLRDYLDDMRITQHFASLNRQAMAHEIVRGMKLDVVTQFSTIHNYIDLDAGILRKGAVSARAGETLLIPINMRDGSLLCQGLGNEDWNQSAPHGAGRLLGRAAAKESFTVSQFKREMRGIYSTSVNKETLDECPMAYKSLEEILRNIAPTARVITRLRPVYNFKASESAK